MTWILLLALAVPCGDELGVRNAHGLVHDASRGTTVLFGGADARAVCGDTWEWDGERWTAVVSGGPSPSPRTFPAMAYDAARSTVVLFGGASVLFGSEPDPANYLGDTWVFAEGAWRELRITSGPGARAEAVMAYDSERERIVLFGGYRLATDKTLLALEDTWEWDGSSWSLVESEGPAPTPRYGAGMAFSSTEHALVLFGGNGARDETWRFDGAWSRIASASRPGRYNAALASDPANGGVIAFGGWDGGSRVADTWSFHQGVWRALEPLGPSARNHASAAYDSRRGRVVLFGGHDGTHVYGDTWEWDGTSSSWSIVLDLMPEARVDNGH